MLVVSYLALQACISFCGVSDKSGALLFLPCSQKMPLRGGANQLPKFMPTSFFGRVSRLGGGFWHSDKEIQVYTGMLPRLAPSWPQILQIRISFRSRTDLVLDADHALDFLSYLVLLACISFGGVLDKRGAANSQNGQETHCNKHYNSRNATGNILHKFTIFADYVCVMHCN